MPCGTFTPRISDIVCRTFVQTSVLALDGKRVFLNFLDEIKSDSKNSNVGKRAARSVTLLAANFGVMLFPNGCENAGRA